MLEFKELTLAQIPLVRPLLSWSRSRICDYTIGGMFMWRDYFHMEYALYQDTFLQKVRYPDGSTAFAMPLGPQEDAALDALEAHCREAGIPLVFCTVSQLDLPLLELRGKVEVIPETDWSDYLYRASDLAQLQGRRYSGQRNHINRFLAEHEDHRFVPIARENLPDVLDFYRRFSAGHAKDSDTFREEERKVFDVLEHYEDYGMLGGAVYVDGRVEAFSLGEIVKDTLFVHVEKADVSIRGIYPIICRDFVRHYATGDVSYVNREEDVGDPGLRASKQSYHPVELLNKYTVVTRHGA